MSEKPDEPFLRRWSRLKRAGGATVAPRKAGGAAPVALARATPAGEPVPVAVKAPPDEEEKRPRTREEEEALIKDLDLPPIESLTKESDVTAFFKDGVPEDLRQKALKRLWSVDPQFDVVDVFTEYGGDYTKMDPIDPVTQTIYKVGMGFLSPKELAAQKGETLATTEEAAAAGKDRDKETDTEKEIEKEPGAAVASEPTTSAAVAADSPAPSESPLPPPFSPPSPDPEPVPPPPPPKRRPA
jgi:hypothetical protein